MGKDPEAFVGKTIIIGITKLDAEGDLVEQVQWHGKIERVTDQNISIRLSNGEMFNLPPVLRSLHDAPLGEYRFRSTGEIVKNPDLMTTWTVHANKDTE